MGYSSLIIPFYGLPQNSSSSKTAGWKSSALLKSTTLRLKILMVYCDTLAILAVFVSISIICSSHETHFSLAAAFVYQNTFSFLSSVFETKYQQLIDLLTIVLAQFCQASGGCEVFKNIHTVTSDSWLLWGVVIEFICGCHQRYHT